MLKIYIINHRVFSYIFEYMKVNYNNFCHLTKSTTYKNACFRDNSAYARVAQVLESIIKKLERGEEASFEFMPYETKSRNVETLVIPSKYITVYENLDSSGLPNMGTRNKVLIGKKYNGV